MFTNSARTDLAEVSRSSGFSYGIKFEVKNGKAKLFGKEYEVGIFGLGGGFSGGYTGTTTTTLKASGNFAYDLYRLHLGEYNPKEIEALFPSFANTDLISSVQALGGGHWESDANLYLPLICQKFTRTSGYDKGFSMTTTDKKKFELEFNIPIGVGTLWHCTFDLGGSIELTQRPSYESYYSVGEKRMFNTVIRPEPDLSTMVSDLGDKILDMFTSAFTKDEENEISEKWEIAQNEKKAKVMPGAEPHVLTTSGSHRYMAADRNGSPVRRKIQRLKDANQSDICRFTFTIPGQNCFRENTEVRLAHHYPAGMLFGVTDQNDTLFVVSEVAELSARSAENEVLGQAPDGSMELSTYVGVDDLTPFGFAENTPLDVYHAEDGSNIWHYVGPAGSALQVDSLGAYILATSIKNDLEAPEIMAEMDSENRCIVLNVTDNIAARISSLRIYINGLDKEINSINETTFYVELTDEEMNNMITLYSTVQDIAGNQGQTFCIFNLDKVSTDIEEVKKDSHEPKIRLSRKSLHIEGAEPEVLATLFSMNGQIMGKGLTGADGKADIELNGMTPGIYIMTLSNGFAKKFVVR